MDSKAPPSPEPPDGTVSAQEALRVLYVRIAGVATCFPMQSPVRFHLRKAAGRVVQAIQAEARDRAGRN